LIAYLSGEITHKTPAFIYVECHGVGYHVNISLNTYSKLEGLSKIKIYTYLNVREDDQSLYGFFDDDERSIFILLISVSGIGVNTARVILSYMNPDEIRTAILHDDAHAFSKAKGVGPKTAKRIILDLKDKVVKEAGHDPIVLVSQSVQPIQQEAISALMALGFPKAIVDKNVKQIVSKHPEIAQVEVLIKMALKQMS
jgi:Holliday junction DNA helicase RuvA